VLRSDFGRGASIVAGALLVLGSYASPGFAASSSTQGLEACQAALGTGFTQSSRAADARCCMVKLEQSWYDQNHVVLGKVYLTSTGQKVRTIACPNNPVGEPIDTPKADPEDTPTSLSDPGKGGTVTVHEIEIDN
jgi:hypothetical protein